MAWLGVRAGAINLLVPGTDVLEVLPFTGCSGVPLTRPHFRGLSNVRGSLFSVIDLPALLGFASVPVGPEARLLLLAPSHMRHTALLINRLLGLYPEPPVNPAGAAEGLSGLADVAPAAVLPPDSAAFLGQPRMDAQDLVWHVLDFAALVALPSFVDVGAPEIAIGWSGALA